jgi:hypothetical protein
MGSISSSSPSFDDSDSDGLLFEADLAKGWDSNDDGLHAAEPPIATTLPAAATYLTAEPGDIIYLSDVTTQMQLASHILNPCHLQRGTVCPGPSCANLQLPPASLYSMDLRPRPIGSALNTQQGSRLFAFWSPGLQTLSRRTGTKKWSRTRSICSTRKQWCILMPWIGSSIIYMRTRSLFRDFSSMHL